MNYFKHINWKILLFTVLMTPVLLSLGFWQLRREAEKSDLQNLYESRFNALPVPLETISNRMESELAYSPVSFSGSFDSRRSFLLDNRTHQGRPGVEVITPFMLVGGGTVLVNRGWLARGQYRTDLPGIDTVAGEVSVRGNVYVPEGEPFMLGDEESFAGWPRLVQAIDVDRMYEELAVSAENRSLAYTVRIQEGMPGAYTPYWQPINMTPEKHRGYAVQWFAMAAALLALFLHSIYRSAKQARKQNHE